MWGPLPAHRFRTSCHQFLTLGHSATGALRRYWLLLRAPSSLRAMLRVTRCSQAARAQPAGSPSPPGMPTGPPRKCLSGTRPPAAASPPPRAPAAGTAAFPAPPAGWPLPAAAGLAGSADPDVAAPRVAGSAGGWAMGWESMTPRAPPLQGGSCTWQVGRPGAGCLEP